jgi:hypothetical protein
VAEQPHVRVAALQPLPADIDHELPSCGPVLLQEDLALRHVVLHDVAHRFTVLAAVLRRRAEEDLPELGDFVFVWHRLREWCGGLLGLRHDSR